MPLSSAVKVKYYDASALVKLYVTEKDSQQLRDYYYSEKANSRTTWLCLAEALGILKSKWTGNQSKKAITKIDTNEYLEVMSKLIINWRKCIDSDDLQTIEPSIPLKVKEIARKYNLDYSDALQLIAIRHGIYSFLAGESASFLITADKDLAFAAESERIRVWNCTTGPAPDWAY